MLITIENECFHTKTKAEHTSFFCKKGNQFWQFSVPLLKCFPDPLQPPIHERIRNKLSKVLDSSSHDNKYSIEIDTHRQVSVRTREHKYAGVGLRRRISSLLLNTLTVCRDNLCSLEHSVLDCHLSMTEL